MSWLLGKMSAITSNALILPRPFPELLLLRVSYGNDYGFGQLASASAACYLEVQHEKQRKLGHCGSSFQQYLKHQCVINTVLVTNPKCSTVWAAVQEINSIPARPSTDAKANYRNQLSS